ncbi:D-alanyl-D-alanine carboxypeptidase family protein [Arthrobacter sp. ATA002]|uniref:D-alanyl-D-alanine carboxypeptidase family protein n=1 Tax=Arthrobacter sp. ATA002 TaxID=2991715 RepID=UPI0022A69F57|nr:D-alanyl-D-alanine carboxypeptidase family protein [Arthrobacter sp. ATA002]WAP52757.1 D-alanyl-D-alanine carboxypeptidase family protein [Arthrobacter sp. ATA002]
MRTVGSLAARSLLTALAIVAGSAAVAGTAHADDDASGNAFIDASTTLGAPVGSRTCGLRDGGCSRDHRYGSMVYSPRTGAEPVRGAIRSAWRDHGAEAGALGYPLDAQACREGTCTQQFERGTVTRSKAGEVTVRLDIDDPAGTAVVVNKQRPLDPVAYVPEDLVSVDGLQLRRAAAASFEMLREAAAGDGAALAAVSGYRSHESQAQLYAGYTGRYGQAAADTISARPGHSEHQTGLAVDIAAPDGACTLQGCFADTAAGTWAAENAYRFGFIIRYPDGASGTTGYAYEPWHLRFVGTDLARSMQKHQSATLEEHLGLPPAADY